MINLLTDTPSSEPPCFVEILESTCEKILNRWSMWISEIPIPLFDSTSETEDYLYREYLASHIAKLGAFSSNV